MKFLPISTLFLWVGSVAGFLYAKDVFLQPVIKFPLFVLLAILLPACFCKLACEKRRLYASIFLGIFLFNASFLTYSAGGNYSWLSTFDPSEELRIDPKLLELVITGEDEEIRHFTAKYLYENHGIQLPFQKQDGSYHLFIPDEASEKIYQEHSVKNAGLKFAKPNVKYQTDALLFLLAIQLIVFILVISLFVLRGDRERSKL